MLDRPVEAVCAGQSRASVLCGEPGAGKTALLQHLTGRPAESRVVQTAGVESEMELAFTGLHQLCVPLLPLGHYQGVTDQFQMCKTRSGPARLLLPQMEVTSWLKPSFNMS